MMLCIVHSQFNEGGVEGGKGKGKEREVGEEAGGRRGEWICRTNVKQLPTRLLCCAKCFGDRLTKFGFRAESKLCE